MSILAYSPWGNGTSCYPFDELYDNCVDASVIGLKEANALLLWGGTDIHPSYYSQKHNINNHAPANPSERDVWEWQAMKYCKANNIPIIGVCRGAQFLCAFAGGSLIQHCTGHGIDHYITTNTAENFIVTSSHHQMLNLRGTDYELIAWSSKNLSDRYEAETKKNIQLLEWKEPEIVYFPKVRGLAIQGHPEWAAPNSKFVAFCLELVSDYLYEETTP